LEHKWRWANRLGWLRYHDIGTSQLTVTSIGNQVAVGHVTFIICANHRNNSLPTGIFQLRMFHMPCAESLVCRICIAKIEELIGTVVLLAFADLE